jgi:drug/metabolite transporter (DMT)-like permease
MKKAFFQLHTAVFLAGFTAILGKLINLNEGLLVWYRLLFSCIILAFILFLRKKLQKISLKDFLEISVVGFILAVHWVTFYGSVKYANASVAVVCISAAGFFSSIIEPLFFRKKMVWIELALGLLSMLGIYIIFDFHPHYKVGVIFGIISAIGSATFPIFNKRLLNRFTPETLTLYEFCGGLISLSLVLPFYFIFYKPDCFIPSAIDLKWLLVLVVFCTVLSFDLQLNALKKISAFTSNLTYNLEPLYGIVLAFIVFNENKMLNNHFYLGLLLIVLSIALQMIRVFYSKKYRN